MGLDALKFECVEKYIGFACITHEPLGQRMYMVLYIYTHLYAG